MIDQKCDHYYISRVQKEAEQKIWMPNSGKSGYDKAGCYSCDGKNTKCKTFSKLMHYDSIIQFEQILLMDKK